MIREWLGRLRLLLRRGRQIDEEIATHLALMAEEFERRGMPPEEARQAALRQFGGVTRIREAYREQHRLPFFDSAARDLRSGLRQLRRSPVFTIATVSLVLVVACCSIANLLMAPGPARTHKIGVRLALGASRMRLLRQLYDRGPAALGGRGRHTAGYPLRVAGQSPNAGHRSLAADRRQGPAGNLFRRFRAGLAIALPDRSLWSGGLCGRAPHAGDRHPAGVGRPARSGIALNPLDALRQQ